MRDLAFLLPADELRPARVDDAFADQADALRAAGARVWLLSTDGRRLITRGDDVAGSTIVYRGWMMTPAAWAGVVAMIEQHGAQAFTSSSAYASAHHIDGWLSDIVDLTPETVLFAADEAGHVDVDAALSSVPWPSFFIKDYVKSLKTSRGSIARSVEEAQAIVTELLSYRDVLEGGLALRRVESFVATSERRAFVVDGVAHMADGSAPPAIVVEVARRFMRSRFFSVDVIDRDDGVQRIVEIGDGQVSDLVGWSPEAFARLWGGP